MSSRLTQMSSVPEVRKAGALSAFRWAEEHYHQLEITMGNSKMTASKHTKTDTNLSLTWTMEGVTCNLTHSINTVFSEDRMRTGTGMEGDREEIKTLAAMEACYQGFDPAAYLQYNYTPPRADFERGDSIVPWKLSCLHNAFTEDDIKGDVLVDVGSGPTFYQVMSGCERFNRVILSDFLEVNRRELQNWLQEGKSSLDWTPYFKYVCKLEDRGSSAWTEKAARLRSVVSDVLPINVHQSRPLSLGSLPPCGADCLVSSFCLESVSPDLPSFTSALSNISSLLKKGGYLLLIGALGESFYMCAPGLCIPVVPLDEAQVCVSLRASGYELQQLCIYHLPIDMKVGVDDVTGVFFAKAKKA